MNNTHPPTIALPIPLQEKSSRSIWAMPIIIAVYLVLVTLLVGCKSTSSQPTNAPSGAPAETSAIDAAQLLETRCSVCHSVDRVKQAQKTQAEWETTVNNMIKKGAQLSEEEKSALLDYLAKTYGP
jgi:hypothetical protein